MSEKPDDREALQEACEKIKKEERKAPVWIAKSSTGAKGMNLEMGLSRILNDNQKYNSLLWLKL